MIKNHQSYLYARAVSKREKKAPKYVKLQCREFLKIADGKDKKYKIDEKKVELCDNLLKIMNMPNGLTAGKPVYSSLAGFQFLLIVASLCVVSRENEKKRKYETVILEIARKQGKTFIIAVLFILLLLTEPPFAQMFSVAPDGSLSRLIKEEMEHIICVSPVLCGKANGKDKFKILRDYIECNITSTKYTPLNYANGRLDGRLPNVFLADEVGALPNNYAIEAMRSGQMTILNKLGFIISTKYPTFNNPFEDEVDIAKKVLDGVIKREDIFALLYEPDNTKKWMTNDNILIHANPLAVEVPEIMQDLYKKREAAIESPAKRENFLTKHCNIIYQGKGTETFIDVQKVKKCKVDKIDWEGLEVFVGVDLSLTTDNTAVVLAGYRDGKILVDAIGFIPEGRVEEKSREERIDYNSFIEATKCIACGNEVIDYSVVENFVFQIEEKYNVTILGIGYDRHNAISSVNKWEEKYETVEVKQHSVVTHRPTKWIEEKILEREFEYEENTLLEINFQNTKCTYDTNLNRYINKKKSNGKIDMIAALVNACFLLQIHVEDNEAGWGAQI